MKAPQNHPLLILFQSQYLSLYELSQKKELLQANQEQTARLEASLEEAKIATKQATEMTGGLHP